MLRQNFWPLREFTDLHDVNRQARQWLAEVANQRQHRETRERPIDRFQPDALRPLPVIPYDYRDTVEALVHKDLRLHFDGNRYCVPHRYVGRRLTVKADSSSVTIYDRVAGDRLAMRAPGGAAKPSAPSVSKPNWPSCAPRPDARRRSNASSQFSMASVPRPCWKPICATWPIPTARCRRQLPELLELIRQYGPEAVAAAIEKAAAARAFGADYVANILRQQQSPRRPQPPLRLRDPLLNELATDPLSLLEYDAFILDSGKESDDSSRTETESTEPDDDEPPTGDDDLTEAAAKNLSVAATLEWLADMELEARKQRAIERRFKCSRLQAQPSIDAFHFHHHKSRLQAKNRILRLLDLEFLAKGTNLVLIGNPGVGKTFLAKIIGWRACQANQRVLFTTAMDMLNHLLASQVDHSLVRKLKTYTEPTLLVCRRARLPVPRPANLQSLLSGHLHAPQPEALHHHHHQHTVLRLGQHPLQYDHRHRHRRSAGGELRDLPAGRRQPAQGQQESQSAGRVV